MPKRIERKRTKGWRMPPGAFSVTRPGMFGNPFIIGVDGNRAACLLWFRECLHRAICGQAFPAHPNGGSLTDALTPTKLSFTFVA